MSDEPISVQKAPEQLTLKELLIEFRAEARGEFKAIREAQEDLTDSRKDHETRIRALEKDGWRKAGAATALGAALGFLADLFVNGKIH